MLAWKAIALDNTNPGIGSSNGINVPERSDMKSDLDLTSNLAFKLNKVCLTPYMLLHTHRVRKGSSRLYNELPSPD